MHEKGYIVNYAVEIVTSIVECFNKHYGNTTSETSKAVVKVHADEGHHLLFDISQILNYNVWSDSMEIAQYVTKLAAFQKPSYLFNEIAIFTGVTSKVVKESFQATIGMPQLTLVLTLLIL